MSVAWKKPKCFSTTVSDRPGRAPVVVLVLLLTLLPDAAALAQISDGAVGDMMGNLFLAGIIILALMFFRALPRDTRQRTRQRKGKRALGNGPPEDADLVGWWRVIKRMILPQRKGKAEGDEDLPVRGRHVDKHY